VIVRGASSVSSFSSLSFSCRRTALVRFSTVSSSFRMILLSLSNSSCWANTISVRVSTFSSSGDGVVGVVGLAGSAVVSFGAGCLILFLCLRVRDCSPFGISIVPSRAVRIARFSTISILNEWRYVFRLMFSMSFSMSLVSFSQP